MQHAYLNTIESCGFGPDSGLTEQFDKGAGVLNSGRDLISGLSRESMEATACGSDGRGGPHRLVGVIRQTRGFLRMREAADLFDALQFLHVGVGNTTGVPEGGEIQSATIF